VKRIRRTAPAEVELVVPLDLVESLPGKVSPVERDPLDVRREQLSRPSNSVRSRGLHNAIPP
jgi:hypothetical protein